MFERFTERARQAVVLAQDEARTLRHNNIGTEHLLLGLLREEQGGAARALAAVGIGLDAARDQVRRTVGMGDMPVIGHVPFTPHARRVLSFAREEATALNHWSVGTEHLLLGLVGKHGGNATRVLEDLVQHLRRAGSHARPLPGGEEDTGERRAVSHAGVGGRCWELGRLDSNQGSRDQNPLPYHLATPH